MTNILPGHNTDIEIQGIQYHVQSEDWGVANPYIVTRVFRQGAVIKTIKTPYGQILPNQHHDSLILAQALKLQHYQILDQIKKSSLE